MCLSHPHEDHGKSLVDILATSTRVGQFWHSVSGIQAWVYSLEDTPIYPSHIRQVAEDYMRGSGDFLRELYGNVAKSNLHTRLLHSGLAPIDVGSCRIHVLAPEEAVINSFQRAYQRISEGNRKHIPDPNLLSCVLAIEYGKGVVILGSDALTNNWRSAIGKFKALKLGKSCLLKVPHHGASNAFDLQANDSATYLGICERESLAVLFAGDTLHPDERVENRIKKKLKLHCLVNGARQKSTGQANNPLNIKIPGAKIARARILPCQSEISVEISEDGEAKVTRGMECSSCQAG